MSAQANSRSASQQDAGDARAGRTGQDAFARLQEASNLGKENFDIVRQIRLTDGNGADVLPQITLIDSARMTA